MSLLGQINIVQSVGRVRSIGHAPRYVRGLTYGTYDRIHERFEKPHDAMGNRYRNPVARLYDRVLNTLTKAITSPIRGIENSLRRIEISIRIRPR
jgi:hypothetical protein